MTPQEIGLVVSATVAIIGVGWKLYDITIGRQKADAAQDVILARLETKLEALTAKVEVLSNYGQRTYDLELKMGLLWRSVEDNLADLLAKGNPINLTQVEQAAALIYKDRKRHSPTNVLKILDQAIVREIPNLEYDEKAAFSLIQSAIRAQLVDRHEFPYQ